MVAAAGFLAGAVGIGAAGATATAWGAAWVAGAGFGATVLGSVTSRLLASVAASALSRALAKKPSKSATGGIRTTSTLTGETNPEAIILGWTATAGQAICPPMSHGAQNRYLTHVVELCSAPGATLGRVIINNDYVTLGADSTEYGRPVTSGTYAGLIWVRYYNGTQTAADPMLRAKYGAHPDRPWTADMVGAGICYAIVTMQYDQERLASVPSYRFEMTGIPLYDPRADSSAGGAGPQRWDDPSTWAQTVNPVVIAYNIMRGIRLPGGDVWGGQIEVADLPMTTWVAGMNVCDFGIDDGAGGTVPQYRCGIEALLSDEPAEILEEVLKACSGDVADIAGRWKIRAGGPGTPVATITDAEVIRTRDEMLDPFPDLASTYNGITATAPNPAALWESKELPARYNAAWEAADRFGRKVASIQLNAVPWPEQGQRLMRAWIEGERRFASHQLALPPAYAALEPMDCIAWASDRNGYVAKQFEISETSDDLMTCIMGLSQREVDPADYAWTPGMALPSTPSAPGLTPPAAEAVSGWAVTKHAIADGSGTARRPALLLSWSPDLIAAGVQWELRVQGTTEVRTGSTQAIASGAQVVADGILSATTYEARGRMIVTGRETAWTAWAAATTDDLRLGEADLDPTIPQAIAAAAQAAEDVRTDLLAAEDARALSEAEIADAISGLNIDYGVAVQAAQDAEDARDQSEAARDASVAARTASETARNQAQTYASNANGSAQAAAGSASTATTKATEAGNSAQAAAASAITATTKAGEASASANASATSAASASTSAGDASTSAAAAETARQAAQTARTGAEVARDTSVTASQTATQAASTATTQAGIATTAANNAGGSAQAAAGSASTATTKATEAAQSASAANTSRTEAATGAATATTKASEASTSASNAAGSAAAAESARQISAQIASQGQSVITDQYLANNSSSYWTAGGTAAASTITRTANAVYPVGQTWRFTLGATDAKYMITTTDRLIWTGQKTASAYVIEAEFDLEAGGLGGAGMRAIWYNTAGSGYAATKNLTSMVSNPQASGRMLARGVFMRPANFTGTFASISIVFDANYLSDIGYGTRVAKTIAVHRIGVRVATAEELGSGAVGSQIAASISAYDLVVVDRQNAIVESVTDLTADYQGTVATVQTHSSALANLNGSVATLDVVTIAGTQYVAGIRATSWDGSGSGSGSLLQLLGDDVVAEGTLSTNRLVVGLSQNLIENSTFRASLFGWSGYGSGGAGAASSLSIRPPGQTWAGIASPTLMIYQSNAATDGWYEVVHRPVISTSGTSGLGVPVVPGEVIEVSANLSAHRCDVQIYMVAHSATGAFVAQSTVWTMLEAAGDSSNPDTWPRIGGRWTVPAGATVVTLRLRKAPTKAGQVDSYVFMHKPQLCRSHAKATTLTPYSPDGTTLVDGGSVVTGSLMAEAANVGSFSAAGLAVFGGNLQSANWDGAGNGWRLTQAGELTVPNASISTAKIGEAQITTLKMRDGDVSFLHQLRTGQLGTWQDNVQNRLVDSWFWVGYDSNVQFDIRVYSNWTSINWMFIWCSAIGTLYNADPANEPFSFSWKEARRITAGSHQFVVEVRTQNATSQALSSVYFDAMGVMR